MSTDESASYPTPPANLPKYVREPLRRQSPSRLRTIASYAEELAVAKERQLAGAEGETRDAETDESEDHETARPESSDVPRAETVVNDVPPKATKTIKTINDNRYWYWQWRDGDAIKSKYIGPVDDSSDS